MSFLEESEKNAEEGITYVQLVTGEFKDTGTPNRPITERERERLQADLEIVNNQFIDIVAAGRSLDRAAVESLADGSSVTGSAAVEAGLIDAVGGRTQAIATFAGLLDVEFEEVSFCEYQRPLLPF
jgi:protease-4